MFGANAFELAGDGVKVVYEPGRHLEVRRDGRSETHRARELQIESVEVGQLISTRGFALLLPHGPSGGGEMSAVALTQPFTGGEWRPTLLRGSAGALARGAAHEVAPGGGRRADGTGSKLPFTLATTIGTGGLLSSNPGPSEDEPSADDEPSSRPDLPDPLHWRDGGPLDDPFGDDDAADDDGPMLPGHHDFD